MPFLFHIAFSLTMSRFQEAILSPGSHSLYIESVMHSHSDVPRGHDIAVHLPIPPQLKPARFEL